MKVLTLMRHAKSSWKSPELDDVSRDLNKRGARDVPLMAKVFADLCEHEPLVLPDLVVSSVAVRARLLAEAVYERCLDNAVDAGGSPKGSIGFELDPEYYTFSCTDLLELIRNLDNEHKSVLVVGHNPALTELLAEICPADILQLNNLPTSAFVSMSFNTDEWRCINECSGVKLLAFDYPKNYFPKR